MRKVVPYFNTNMLICGCTIEDVESKFLFGKSHDVPDSTCKFDRIDAVLLDILSCDSLSLPDGSAGLVVEGAPSAHASAVPLPAPSPHQRRDVRRQPGLVGGPDARAALGEASLVVVMKQVLQCFCCCRGVLVTQH